MLTKKNVLIISALYMVVFGITVMFNSACYNLRWCQENLWFFIETFSPLAPVFIFTLITYWMRDEVFDAWISFARWFVPIIFVVTLIFGGGGGGGMGISGAISGWFNAIIIGAFYVVFVVISLYKIIHAHNLLKERALKKLHKHETKHHP